MKAVIYLVSDSYNRWDVEEYGVDKNPMMKEEQVREMIESGLVEFGGHTLHHCDFHVVNEETAKREILEIKENWKKISNFPKFFCLSLWACHGNGKKIVKEVGYRFAVSTSTGTGIITDDLYEMRRTSIDRTSVWRFLKRISGRYSVYKGKNG